MTKVPLKIVCRKETKRFLKLKKEETGRSVSSIVEYAINNIPYIPPKVKKK